MSEVLEEAPVAGDAVDANAEVVETPVVEAPSPPAYDPTEDPRILDLVQAQAAQIADQRFQALVAEAQAQSQQGQQPQAASFVDEYGNIDADGLAQFLAQERQQTLAEIKREIAGLAAPLQARQEAETVAEGEQRIKDMIADDISRNGDLPAKAQELIRPLADQFFGQFAARFGNGPRAAEMAVGKAAAVVREIAAEASQTAVATENNRLATIAGVRPELGAAGIAGVETFSDKPLTARELSTKYGQKAQALRQAPAA